MWGEEGVEEEGDAACAGAEVEDAEGVRRGGGGGGGAKGGEEEGGEMGSQGFGLGSRGYRWLS